MKRDVASFRRRPLPVFDFDVARGLRRGARSHPIDTCHPLNSEKLIDIREFGVNGENYYHMREGNPPYDGRIETSIPHLLLRLSVARRLAAANEELRSIGVELFVLDAFRTTEHQDHMFEVWMPEFLRREHPDWNDSEIDRERRVFWGKATNEHGSIDPLSPPLHATGGAVDLTLRDFRTKMILPMGCGFDDFSASHASFTDFFERLRTDRHSVLSLDEEEILGNRRLIYWVLREFGFVNNPNEVWHYDLYDQMWAALKREETAFYSLAFLPFLE